MPIIHHNYVDVYHSLFNSSNDVIITYIYSIGITYLLIHFTIIETLLLSWFKSSSVVDKLVSSLTTNPICYASYHTIIKTLLLSWFKSSSAFKKLVSSPITNLISYASYHTTTEET